MTDGRRGGSRWAHVRWQGRAGLAIGPVLVVLCVLAVVELWSGDPAATSVRGSSVVAVCVWGFLVLMLAAGVVLVPIGLDDPPVDRPGRRVPIPLLVGLGAAIVWVPVLARAVTGRLHRWEVRWGGGSLQVRGWWTGRTIRWSDVQGVSVEYGTAGVLVVTVAGQKPVGIATVLYDVPAEDLLDPLRSRVRGGTGPVSGIGWGVRCGSRSRLGLGAGCCAGAATDSDLTRRTPGRRDG